MKRFIWILIFLGLVRALPAQTIESVMRALQERHMAVEQKSYAIKKMAAYNPKTETFAGNYSSYELTPINWGSGVADLFPVDGALDGMEMEGRLAVLNRMRDAYNALIKEYVFPSYSPSLSSMAPDRLHRNQLDLLDKVDAENFLVRLRQIGSGVNQMKYLQWSSIVQETNLSSDGLQYKAADISDTAIDVGDLGRSYSGGEGPWRVGQSWNSYYNSRPIYWFLTMPSTMDMDGAVFPNYKITNAFLETKSLFNYAYAYGGSGGEILNYLDKSYHLGHFIFTGDECAAELAGKFYFIARQVPVEPSLASILNIPNGAWPIGNDPFRGYQISLSFLNPGDKIQSGIVLDAETPPLEKGLPWGDAIGSIKGSWQMIRDHTWGGQDYFFISDNYSPDFSPWGSTSDGEGIFRYARNPFRPIVYQSSEGVILFEPTFVHSVQFPQYSLGSGLTVGESISADMRKQMAYINMGRGMDGVAVGYLGVRAPSFGGSYFSTYRAYKSFWGFGAVIDLMLFSNPGQFEVYYDANVEEVPGGIAGILGASYLSAYDYYVNGSWVSTGYESFTNQREGVRYALGMEWLLYPRIKQVVGLDVIADVEVVGSGTAVDKNRYTIKLYRAWQKGGFVNGKYAVNGEPFDVIEVRDDGYVSGGASKVSLTGQRKKITIDYACTALDGWPKDADGNSIRNNAWEYRRFWKKEGTGEELVQYGFGGFSKITTETVPSGSSGNIIEEFDSTNFVYLRKQDEQVIWREKYASKAEFFQKALTPESPIFTSSITIGSETGDSRIIKSANKAILPDKVPRVESITGAGWFWQEFDDRGRVVKRIDQLESNPFPSSSTPWPDGSNYTTENTYSGNVQTTVNQRAGSVSGRSWRVWNGLTQVSDYVATDLSVTSYSDDSNLKTTTTYYGGGETTGGAEPWAVKSIVYSDGTASVYSYSYNSTTNQKTVTVSTGQPNAPNAPTSITKGTQTVTITNIQGYALSSITTAIPSSVVLASEVVPSGQVDAFGRPTKVDYLDETHVSRTYYPDFRGLIQTETDRNGVESTYTYDVLNRLRTVVRDGVTTTIAPAGLTTTTTHAKGSLTHSETSTVNLLGELQSASSTMEPATSTSVAHTGTSTDARFVSTTTETGGSGLTVIRTTYEDGSLESVKGTSTLSYRYDYGIAPFAGGGGYDGKSLSFTNQIKLTDAGSDTGTYIKTWSDGAGRVVAVETPSATGSGAAYAFSYYNDKGQLEKTVDADGAVMLFAYDEQGRQTTVARDIDKDGLICAEDEIATTLTTYEGGQATTTVKVGFGTAAKEVSRTVTTIATGVTTVVPNNKPALATTITPNIADKKIEIVGVDGSATYDYNSNGSLKTSTVKSSSGATLDVTNYDRDGFARLTQTSSVAGGATRVTNFNAEGEISGGSATGTGVASQAFSVTYNNLGNGAKKIDVTNTVASKSQSVTLNGRGELLERSGFGTFDMTLEHAHGAEGVTTTLKTTTGGAETVFTANSAGVLTDKAFNGGIAGPSSDHSLGGLVTSRTMPAGGTVTYGYGDDEVESGKLKTISYPTGSDMVDVEFTYDSEGQVETVTDASGSRTLTYANGQLKSETYTAGPLLGIVINRSFDDYDRRDGLSLKYLTNSFYEVSYGYQGTGSSLASITKGNVSAHYTYQSNTLLIDEVIQKRAGTTVLTTKRNYDPFKRLSSIVATAGGKTASYAYQYNAAGKRDRITRENNDYWSLGYQADGQLHMAIKKNSLNEAYPGFNYAYDFTGIGSRSKVAVNDTPTVDREADYGYDSHALNQVTSREVPGFVDVLGRVEPLTNVTVDVRDQSSPIAKKGTWNASTAGGGFNGSGYLTDGNAEKGRKWVDYSTVVAPGTYTVEMIWSASTSNSAAVPVIINAGGIRRTQVVNQQANGGSWMSLGSYGMPSGGRLSVRVANMGTTGLVVADAVRIVRTIPSDTPWVQTLDSENAAEVTTLVADKLGDIFHKAIPMDNSAGPVATEFDITGTLPQTGGGPDAMASMQVSTIVPPAESDLDYDLDGQREGDWKWSYSWNAAGQLVSVESSAAVIAIGEPHYKLVFKYDSEGRRFSKKVYCNEVETESLYFIYDGWNLIAELNEAKEVVRSYTWGLDISQGYQGAGGVGGLLSIHSGAAAYFPTYDGSGNITGLVNSSTGVTEASYEYAPFGELIRASGVASGASPFGFSTKYTDKETGFCYYGNRYYDPQFGHWISRELLGEMESENLYAFCGNDPVNNIDYLGLAEMSCVVCHNPTVVFEGGLTDSYVSSLSQARQMALLRWITPNPVLDTRLKGGIQYIAGSGEAIGGVAAFPFSWGGSSVMIFHGWDTALAGSSALWNGAPKSTFTFDAIKGVGVEGFGLDGEYASHVAEWGDLGFSLVSVPSAVLDFLKIPRASQSFKLIDLDIPNIKLVPSGDVFPRLSARQAGALFPQSKPLSQVLTPIEQAKFKLLEAKYPGWMPKQGLETRVNIRTIAENASARLQVDGLGHHPQPLKFNGDPNPADGLIFTGETRMVKNPIHTEITEFWNSILRRLRSQYPTAGI